MTIFLLAEESMNKHSNDKTGTKGILIVIYILEILLLIPWFPFAALSAMAYDSGEMWPAILIVGPFQAFPALIVIGLITSSVLYSNKKYQLSIIVAIAPPVISFGWLLAQYI